MVPFKTYRFLQQKQGYQAPEILPVFENNNSLQFSTFMGLSCVRLTYPDGIGINLVEFDNWTSLHVVLMERCPKLDPPSKISYIFFIVSKSHLF
jgi:hypothetical protein